MEAIAFPPATEGVFQTIGHLVAAEEHGWTVRTDEGSFQARRATSCLLQPQIGDKVLLVGEPLGELYVLAVLERQEGVSHCLSTDGDLKIELQKGRFTVAASEGVDLVSAREVSLLSKRIEARASEGLFSIGKVRAMGNALDAVYERLSQTVQVAFRKVHKLDRLQAGQIDYSADGMARVHGENTVLTADGLVKADGKQIHIG